MSTERAPHQNQEYESLPVISYDEYRAMCDDMQPDVSRKTGISTQEDYEAACQSNDSIFIEMGRYSIPLFVPAEHAGGYNEENSRRLTGKDDVFTLAIPPLLLDIADIDIKTYLEQVGDNAAIIIQTPSEKTDEFKAKMEARIGAEGKWKSHDFIDPRLPEEAQKAQISIYEAILDARDEEGVEIPWQGKTFREAYNDEVREHGETTTKLIEAEDVINNEELFEQLWNLHDTKFDMLGEYHPVSMQENKEFFRQLLHDEHTKSLVRFEVDEDGRQTVVAHGCFMEGIDRVEWLTDRYHEKTARHAEAHDEHMIFFYGIASKSNATKTLHYARDIIRMKSRLLQRQGGKTNLIFESTNMSSLYIPRMVQAYIDEEPDGIKVEGEIEAESRLDYWFLLPGSSHTV